MSLAERLTHPVLPMIGIAFTHDARSTAPYHLGNLRFTLLPYQCPAMDMKHQGCVLPMPRDLYRRPHVCTVYIIFECHL